MLRARMKDVQQYPRYYVQCDTVDLRPPKDVAIATFTCLQELVQLVRLYLELSRIRLCAAKNLLRLCCGILSNVCLYRVNCHKLRFPSS
jgi:hypothetical protein